MSDYSKMTAAQIADNEAARAVYWRKAAASPAMDDSSVERCLKLADKLDAEAARIRSTL